MGVKTKSIDGMTVQAWLEQGIKDKGNAPFERVRLVDQAFDIISPELPPEKKLEPVKATNKRKTKADKVTGQPEAKRARKGKGTNEAGTKASKPTMGPLLFKLKVPKPVREKEVDSDGDTVGGYSDDAAKSDGSSLTSLSDSEGDLPIPARFAFPPRPVIAGHAGISEKTAVSPVTPHAPGQARPVPPSRESSASSGETRRRKRPPPKANIVRIPKHAISAPGSALPTSVSSQVEPTPMLPSMSFQSFSYDGFSTIPPPALPQYPPYPSNVHHGLPPPYSHSPQYRPTELPQQAHDVYTSIATASGHPTVLADRLGTAAGVPASVPMGSPAHDGLGNVWSHDQAIWLQTGELMENGLTMDRRYHPDYP
jgi:hypothetical protein